MKKVIAFVTVVLCCSMTTLMAQGGGQQMTPEQRIAMMKERYKGMGLNDVQTDSVIAVSNDMRALRGNMREMTEEQRAAKMKEVNEVMQKRLEKAIGTELTKKVMEAMAQQRQRPPGGGGK